MSRSIGRHHVGVRYDPTIYQGTAAHYRYGRPAYSPQLEAVLTAELGLDGTGKLLDGGCGPGILTVRLAHLFEDVVALDPDPAMLAEGRRVASEQTITNIRWVEALAEELPEAAPGPYRVVTFGQSFHWTDEARVAEAVFDMLEPGGAFALIVHTVDGRPAPPNPGRTDQGADREVPRVNQARRPGHRAGSNPPFRTCPRSYPVRRPAVDLRPRHPRPGAGHRERPVGLLLHVIRGPAPVRRARR